MDKIRHGGNIRLLDFFPQQILQYDKDIQETKSELGFYNQLKCSSAVRTKGKKF